LFLYPRWSLQVSEFTNTFLGGIPQETFLADDALGWVYQFWQKDKKGEINASERKIGGADLGPVTQLFTENYMVRFLLENSLGAWWAARHPHSALVKGFHYLRSDDGKPAAGSFEAWPPRVADVTVIDPCCGSGHFLIEAFSMLWQMRAEEEELAPVEAQDAVLRDNLFGLELDPRCVQIAMFNVALQAWKAGGGWRQLPVPNIACSGIPVKAPVEEWRALARGDERIGNALVRLHILFREADTLGSLIDPKRATEIADPTGSQRSFEDVEWSDITPLLEAAASREATDPAIGVLGAEATSIARAAELLSRSYTLVITNVPYLSRAKQVQPLRDHLEHWYEAGMADLATAFVLRSLELGTEVALVTPQSWHQQGSYTALRELILRSCRYRCMARLGNNCWQSRVSSPLFKFHTVLSVIGTGVGDGGSIAAFDIGNGPASEKATELLKAELIRLPYQDQLANPDARLMMQAHAGGALLSKFCIAATGVQTGDSSRYIRKFWEAPDSIRWVRMQSTALISKPFTGREHVLDWDRGQGALSREPSAYLRNTSLWGQQGVAVKQMGDLHATLYTGEAFDNNTAILLPHKIRDLPSIWAFVSSPQYARLVREINARPGVTTADLAKVPFDAEYWRRVAEEAGPLPEPWSDDPTQWLFEGRPEMSTAPLQVAVGRLVGYSWPGQQESDDLDAFADTDGIVCLPAVAGEPPAADRVQMLLAAAFGDSWSPAKVRELLEQVGSKKKSLADWLRDEFFKQHCALFGNRPFVWHVWDGQRDGFSALVNYHRLDRKTLEKLTYTYLGQDWVERQRAEVRDEVAGAEARLAAALRLQRKLEAILGGEAPLDIFVRWKEKHEQPIGWEPDLNDGVRLNIRPFVEAGVLRAPLNIHWRKDRGKNLDGTERHNDKHFTLGEKLQARKKVDTA
ncbi:N-6 DNA methylase, partial [Rhodococcus ruber]|uniref:Eco57I restriction-modification methylase domain-containing protein n=1 Tax=Rhodococcus ruber TaxID=1830 RepID=UPI0022B3E8C4